MWNSFSKLVQSAPSVTVWYSVIAIIQLCRHNKMLKFFPAPSSIRSRYISPIVPPMHDGLTLPVILVFLLFGSSLLTHIIATSTKYQEQFPLGSFKVVNPPVDFHVWTLLGHKLLLWNKGHVTLLFHYVHISIYWHDIMVYLCWAVGIIYSWTSTAFGFEVPRECQTRSLNGNLGIDIKWLLSLVSISIKAVSVHVVISKFNVVYSFPYLRASRRMMVKSILVMGVKQLCDICHRCLLSGRFYSEFV